MSPVWTMVKPALKKKKITKKEEGGWGKGGWGREKGQNFSV